jgi:hypothetical protein
MAVNRYDQASRHLARQAGGSLWPWLLDLSADEVRFERLLQTHFTLPGFPERVGDTVAALTDLQSGGRPWAVCLEFQSEPDFDMSDRLLVILGLLRLTEKPSAESGDRYWVGAVVVNLTGRGQAERDLHWSGAGLRLLLEPREWNVPDVEAAQVLRQVEEGAAPVEALAWLPLMQGGSDSAMIRRWLELARREKDSRRRADLGLVLVFAELANCQDVWRKALEGWDMKESQIVKEWEDKARREGEAKGKTEGKAEALLQFLQKRFKTVPDDLRTAILAAQEDRLTGWLDVAFTARSLRRFRAQAGL